jgi:hypothetical protein
MSYLPTKYTLVFHGNCIDGWFSAYIAYSSLQANGGVMNMFPISPNQRTTWPRNEQLVASHVLLLDVSVPKYIRDMWMKSGALSVHCIDHHASAIEHWPKNQCPIDTSRCAAYQTWQRFYPQLAIPSWLEHIDRVDRWDNPSHEDRCIREVLNIIAHKPVENKYDDAFTLTEMFLTQIQNPAGAQILLNQGAAILEKKDAELIQLLNNGGIHHMTEDHVKGWQLPAHWLNASVFIIDTTNVSLDTTEAAHLVFLHYPAVQVFINYRKKSIMGHLGNRTMFVYSARSRGFDLTSGCSILKGHKTAAGASLVMGEANVLPFLVTAM